MMIRTGFTSMIAALALLQACQPEEPAPPPEPVIRPVRFEEVAVIGASRERILSGIARAGAEITMSFRIPGTVQQVAVDVGDRVEAGQLIARLDPRDYQLQVEDVQASLAQGRAQARNAAADLERVRGLYENNNASRDDLDAALTAEESLQATVRSIEKKLELAELQLSYCELRSGADGAIAEVAVEVNENVNAGGVIVVINSGATPEVEVAVPESLISQVREGSRVTVRFDALPEASFSAIVTEVGVSPTRTATTFPVVARLSRADTRILPGMAVEATFLFGTDNAIERIVVPAQSVAEDADGNYVYIVEDQGAGLGQVRRRSVRVGELVSEGLEVLEGLAEGERVVTAGVNRIADGQSVRILRSNGS